MWRFKGSPHYLDLQAKRLGITQVLADRARHNPNVYRMAILLSQLCERYHQVRREDDKPVFCRTELDQIKGTLDECELELRKLHLLAAAADAMLGDAWQAFGYETPRRRFEVTCEFDGTRREALDQHGGHGPPSPDQPPFPLGDGTVGIPDDESELFAQTL